MGEIKSALEIALEKTQSVEGGKEIIEAEEARKEGKMLVSRFLNDQEFSLKRALGEIEKNRRRRVLEGMVDVLLANLVLPQDQLGTRKAKRVGEAFSLLNSDRRISQLFGQLETFFGEFVEERERVREMVTQQYGPRLRQKEQELSQRMGQPVHIDPMSDPEFQATLRKAMSQLEDRYGTVLARVKGDLKSLAGQAG
jgi:hypothetical protein